MDIQEITFGPKQYLTIRKVISISQITDKKMYDEAGRKLHDYIEKNNVHALKGWSILYFLWDKVNQKADIGISVPVMDLKEVNDSAFTLTEIPETKASLGVMKGDYSGLSATHESLMNYARENHF